MYANIIKINLDKLLKANLSLTEYFILDCIQKNSKELLEEYVEKCGKLDKLVFDSLQENLYIENIDGDITFDKLKLTKKAIDYLGSDVLDHNRYFKELTDIYPKSVKVLRGRRPLQQNIPGCKKAYKAIVDSEEKHNLILKCVKLYFEDLEKTNRLEFAQLLSSWLNQHNYEVYLEEAKRTKDIPTKEEEYDII